MAGGYSNGEFLSSTEILKDGDSLWFTVGNLPEAVSRILGVSIDNKILMTGEQAKLILIPVYVN